MWCSSYHKWLPRGNRSTWKYTWSSVLPFSCWPRVRLSSACTTSAKKCTHFSSPTDPISSIVVSLSYFVFDFICYLSFRSCAILLHSFNVVRGGGNLTSIETFKVLSGFYFDRFGVLVNSNYIFWHSFVILRVNIEDADSCTCIHQSLTVKKKLTHKQTNK